MESRVGALGATGQEVSQGAALPILLDSDGAAGTKDAAVAGTEDVFAACMLQCRRRYQTAILWSPASSHVWSKLFQHWQRLSGGTGPQGSLRASSKGCFQWFKL